MKIIVNAQDHDVPPDTTLMALLTRFELQPVRVAVEHNGVIIPKKNYATTTLAAGDKVEIVTFVGGG